MAKKNTTKPKAKRYLYEYTHNGMLRAEVIARDGNDLTICIADDEEDDIPADMSQTLWQATPRRAVNSGAARFPASA